MKSIAAGWDQLLKNVDEAPGWALLFLVAFLTAELLPLPERLFIWGLVFPLSDEVLAGIATLLGYGVGDAIDEAVFKVKKHGDTETKEFFRERYRDTMDCARKALNVGEGIYRVSFKLAKAASKDGTHILITLPNELAKALRGLIFISVVLAVWSLISGRPWLASASAVGAVLFGLAFPWLKVLHINKLYRRVTALEANKKLQKQPLGNFTLVFWDGTFVDAGVRYMEPAA